MKVKLSRPWSVGNTMGIIYQHVEQKDLKRFDEEKNIGVALTPIGERRDFLLQLHVLVERKDD